MGIRRWVAGDLAGSLPFLPVIAFLGRGKLRWRGNFPDCWRWCSRAVQQRHLCRFAGSVAGILAGGGSGRHGARPFVLYLGFTPAASPEGKGAA